MSYLTKTQKMVKYLETRQKTVHEKIRDGYYQNKLPYIDLGASRAPLRNVGNLMMQLFKLQPNNNKARQSVMDSVPPLIQAYDDARAQLDLYHKEGSNLHQMFRDDLASENGLSNHPKKDLLFSKAWDRGHSGGLEDVVAIYEDLMELIT